MQEPSDRSHISSNILLQISSREQDSAVQLAGVMAVWYADKPAAAVWTLVNTGTF